MKLIPYKQKYAHGEKDDSHEVLMNFVNEHVEKGQYNPHCLRLNEVTFDVMTNRRRYHFSGQSFEITFIKMNADDIRYKSVVRKVAVKDGMVDLDEVLKKYQELKAIVEDARAQRKEANNQQVRIEKMREALLKRAGLGEDEFYETLRLTEHSAVVKLSSLTHEQAEEILKLYKSFKGKA